MGIKWAPAGGSSGWTVILNQTKHVKKTLYAFPASPGVDSGSYRPPQPMYRTPQVYTEGGGGVEFETKTNVDNESDTYNFDLQGINFSLDPLLLLLVQSLVGFGTTVFNECDC